jgi:hypothetical protein
MALARKDEMSDIGARYAVMKLDLLQRSVAA